MRKYFVQNILFLILVNLIVKPIWIFGVDRQVQNIVGHEQYGLYQALFNISVIFQILLDFGLQQYYVRRITIQPSVARKIFPNVVIGKLILSVIYLIILFFVSLSYTNDFTTKSLLFSLALLQIITSFLLFFRTHLSAVQKFKSYSILSVVDRLIVVIICFSIFYWHLDFITVDIFNFIWIQNIALLLTCLVALIICIKHLRPDWSKLHINRLVTICKQSFPYAILIFLMSIYQRLDIVMLNDLNTNNINEAGRYAAAFRLLDVCNNMTGLLFAGLLLPIFSKLLNKNEELKQIVNTSVNLLIPFSITVAIACTLWGGQIMSFLYHDVTPQDGYLLALLMWTFPLYSFNFIYSTLLTANGNIKFLISLSLVAVLTNISLNYYFINQILDNNIILYVGSTAIVTQLMVSFGNIIYTYYKFKFKMKGIWMIKMIVSVLLIWSLGYLIEAQLTNLSLLSKLIFIGLGGLLSIILLNSSSLPIILKILRKKN